MTAATSSDQGGERKLLAVARHIANTLATDDVDMADDVLRVYSHFDARLSRAATLPDRPLSSSSAAVLAAVDELQATLRLCSRSSLDDPSLDRAHDLLHQAVFRLEDDFRHLMTSSAAAYSDEDDDAVIFSGDDPLPIASRLSDYNVLIDAISSATIADLHEIAKRMVSMEFGIDCSRVYASCRRDFLEESMCRLGFQSITPEVLLSMPWSEMECRIDRWIKAANVLLRVLLPSERRLCDRVFSGMAKTADLAFLDTCRGSTIQLLHLAGCFLPLLRSPERLFKALDLFENLRDLMPEFNLLFGDTHSVFLRDDAVAVLSRTGESIRGIFVELESLISRDPAKAPVPGADLHPITRYVMNYLRAACRSPQTLAQIFDDNTEVIHIRLENRPCSSLALQITWIMDILESNLDVKSKIYDDPSMSCIFMINNKMYMIQKARDGELGGLLGSSWVRKHMAKVWKLLSDYHKLSWSIALSWLSMEDDSSVRPLAEKLDLFNCHFADKCKVQSTWVICDGQVRDEARAWLEENLIPPYRRFVSRVQSLEEFGKSGEKKIKFYSSKEIESGINNLFRGGVGC